MTARQPAADRPDRRDDQPAEHLHGIAHVERLLRDDGRAAAPHVDIDASGARLSFRSAEFHPHARGSLTADVCSEIAATDAWGLATVHDPMVREDGSVISMLTVVYAPDEVER